jgi:micrococcal nuclease
MQPEYKYRAIVTEVYDGDTITVDLDLGFYTWIKSQKLRLRGIDTPEMNSKDAAQRDAAFKARDALRSLIWGKLVVVETVKDGKDKYGRWLATVYIEENKGTQLVVTNVNQWMLDRKLGVSYSGGAKD